MAIERTCETCLNGGDYCAETGGPIYPGEEKEDRTDCTGYEKEPGLRDGD